MIRKIVELYRQTAEELPVDIVTTLKKAFTREENSLAKNILQTILQNIDLAKKERKPLCQDTGVPIFYVQYQKKKYSAAQLTLFIKKATKIATREVPLRPNALAFPSGKGAGNQPIIYFEEGKKSQITLLLRGGGAENVSCVYKLAERNWAGVEKCILETVFQAQGQGCPPYFIGVAVAADIAEAAFLAQKQLLQKFNQTHRILEEINSLGIGPMGLGGKSTALGLRFISRPTHPASCFVGVSLNCWCLRRQSLCLP